MMAESAEGARFALKTFFDAERELTASFVARAITRVTYLTALQGLRDRLCERSYVGLVMLRAAEDLLEKPGVYLGAEHRKQAEALGEAYMAWVEDFRRTNVERIALSVLDGIAGLTVAPLPDR